MKICIIKEGGYKDMKKTGRVKRSMALLLALSLVLCLLMAGCAGKPPEESPGAPDTPSAPGASQNVDTPSGPKQGGVLRYASGNGIVSPGYTPECTNNASLLFLTTAYESLVTYAEDGSTVGLLATGWEIDADEPSITWTLRENVKFADGEPFNAEAVKRNIEEYQSKERTETAVITSMEVIDDTHIKMVLDNWSSSAVESIGFFVYYMSPKALEDVDALRTSSCGTGPFQVSEFNPGVSIKYTKNTGYWQQGKPYLDGVEIYVVEQQTTLSSAFQAGEYDMIMLADMTIASDLMAMGSTASGTIVNETNTNGQGLTICGFIPNSADPSSPFADARVRRAMALAVDAGAICDAFGYGVYTPTDQWATPEAITYNTGITPLGYDPNKARALLAEAGYPDGFNTTLTVSPYVSDYFTAAAAMLDEVGIHCELNMVDNATEVSMYSTGSWEGIMGHYATISPDLGLYMGRHLDYNGTFYAAGIQHPEDHMELLEKIRASSDEKEKLDYEWQLQALIYDKETGSALFGKPLLVIKNMYYKYDYLKDDGRAVCEANIWSIADAWMDK